MKNNNFTFRIEREANIWSHIWNINMVCVICGDRRILMRIKTWGCVFLLENTFQSAIFCPYVTEFTLELIWMTLGYQLANSWDSVFLLWDYFKNVTMIQRTYSSKESLSSGFILGVALFPLLASAGFLWFETMPELSDPCTMVMYE